MQGSQVKRQRRLFEEPLAVPTVRLPQEVQENLRQVLGSGCRRWPRRSKRRTTMNKITADHLARRACVYVRQSLVCSIDLLVTDWYKILS